jgi:hypothetical protein
MITVLFSVQIKDGSLPEFQRVAAEMTRTSRADDGCIAYTFYRQADDEHSYVLFEQWREQPALTAHLQRLLSDMGPPDTDPGLPEAHVRRRLPMAFMDLLEAWQVRRYEELPL